MFSAHRDRNSEDMEHSEFVMTIKMVIKYYYSTNNSNQLNKKESNHEPIPPYNVFVKGPLKTISYSIKVPLP